MVCEAHVAMRVRGFVPFEFDTVSLTILSHFLCPPSSLGYNQIFRSSRPRCRQSVQT